jgi:COP9 signalosome complex subunit 3
MGMGMGMGMGGMGMGMGMGLGMGMGIGIGMGSSGPGSRYANPGPSDPSIFQVEAAKKLLLVQLILHGKTLPLPKYTHPTVANLKGTPYNTLVRAYPNLEQVHAIATKERNAFSADNNYGLLRLVVDRAPRWAIRKLTDTYLTLSVPEIGRAAGIEDVAEVRRIVVSMIETGEIEASIDADGSVTFADDEPAAVSKAEIDRALRVAQEQEQVLRKLEREIARNKDYLQKAVRNREEGSTSNSSSNWPYIEEELWASSSGSRWAEESVY